MNKETRHIDNIGTIVFTRRHNSARISMRLKHDNSLSVNYPWQVGFDDVLQFVYKNQGWIEEQRKKNAEKRRIYYPGDIFQSRFHRIQIVTSPKASGYANIDHANVLIAIPGARPPEDEKTQQFIKQILTEVYRREARSFLPDRVKELADQHGFSFKAVFIKKLKSKWGSCSRHGNINLNLYLMTLPDHLIDYIVLHELVHTVELNHGSGFWKHLDQVTEGHAAQLDKEMKSCKILF